MSVLERFPFRESYCSFICGLVTVKCVSLNCGHNVTCDVSFFALLAGNSTRFGVAAFEGKRGIRAR